MLKLLWMCFNGLEKSALFMKAGLLRMRTYVRREIQLNSREIQRATNMSLLELSPTIFGGTEAIIDYLRRHHLLAERAWYAEVTGYAATTVHVHFGPLLAGGVQQRPDRGRGRTITSL